eukprot:g16402.t1
MKSFFGSKTYFGVHTSFSGCADHAHPKEEVWRRLWIWFSDTEAHPKEEVCSSDTEAETACSPGCSDGEASESEGDELGAGDNWWLDGDEGSVSIVEVGACTQVHYVGDDEDDWRRDGMGRGGWDDALPWGVEVVDIASPVDSFATPHD